MGGQGGGSQLLADRGPPTFVSQHHQCDAGVMSSHVKLGGRQSLKPGIEQHERSRRPKTRRAEWMAPRMY